MIENPLQHARRNAHKVVQALEMHLELKDVRSGKVKLLWSYGVVLASISREQFNGHEIDEVLAPDRVICKDEMMDSVNSVAFQQRLVAMMPSFRKNGIALSKKEIDRVRWAIFPEYEELVDAVGNGQIQLMDRAGKLVSDTWIEGATHNNTKEDTSLIETENGCSTS